jgi:uncharacterized protein
MKSISFTIIPAALAICRLPASSPLPDWAMHSEFGSFTRTAEELSLVCGEAYVPISHKDPDLRVEWGWRGLKVVGPLNFALTGILAGIATVLADAGISLFAISTFDTDYILVRGENLAKAVDALTRAGHQVL